MNRVEIGVIGGSGFYTMGSVKEIDRVSMKTPFGDPSEDIFIGDISGRVVAFLSRHGIGHRLGPSEVNYRANLFAMKMLGVHTLLSVTAVGSLKEELKPTHLVIPDQFVDMTYHRRKTYFENGIVAHVSMAEPTCPVLTEMAYSAALEAGQSAHLGGVYLNIEGPQFSTRAESNLYRQQGFSVIGMTQAVESKLARELEMCFLPLAFVTDYDCWHEEEAPVSVELVIENLQKNAVRAECMITTLVTAPPSSRRCTCRSALEHAIITSREKIPQAVRETLEPLIGRYL